MSKYLLFALLAIGSLTASAKHITGGEVVYDFIRNEGNAKVYRITLILFRDNLCGINCAELPASVTVAVYNNDNNLLVGGFRTVTLNSESNLAVVAAPACLTNPPNFNYSGGFYATEVTLPNNVRGYTYTFQTCCRIASIENIPPVNAQQDQGVTYTSEIPGSQILGSFLNDNSARFQTGISILCFDKKYILDFSATDPDGDSLVYSLCPAYDGGGATNAGYSTPAPPPYNDLIYNPGFSGIFPFGNGTTPATAIINPQTGIITGRAPAAGQYVMSVCVSSYRNGQLMNIHRKDFIITVSPCDFSAAELDLQYTNCKDSTFTFQNNNNSPLNQTFTWYFGDGTSSTDEMPTHTYADTGSYTIKLVVNAGTPCADSTTSTLLVFPTFDTDFTESSPACINTAVAFSDATFATYPPINSYAWTFGDPSSGALNNSNIANPTHSYATAGIYTVRLITTSAKGCRDTASKPVTIVTKPAFSIGNDTLICVIDTLQLNAVVGGTTNGTINWTPNYNISDVNSFNPLVSPDVTTTYIATYTDNGGCFASDTITINVVSGVSITTMRDTTICRTDSVKLNVTSNATGYSWTPANLLNNPSIEDPTALPVANSTDFIVNASIGKCTSQRTINVRTVPFPNANAGRDTTVCNGSTVQLRASGGSSYNWSPAFFLSATNIPNPIATPPASITYVVTVTDTLGCPKPVKDTVRINVIRIIANAGPRDTSIVLGQPLQLNASGGNFYQWTPSTYLNNNSIPNPISNPLDSITYFLTVSDSIGCFGRDTIRVLVYRLAAGLYVPTAFTPNGNGVNDLFRPIALGIRSLEFFRVYNRWGELVYATSELGEGWDGNYKGRSQGTSAFVWQASAIDYTGKKIFKKGSVVLIK